MNYSPVKVALTFAISVVILITISCAGQQLPVAPTTNTQSTPTMNQSQLDSELIEAVRRGDLSRVKSLLAQGASVHATDSRSQTALIAAAYADHVEIGRALITAGADVNVK